MNKTNIGKALIKIFLGTPHKEILADVWRSYVMYTKGGVYADVDTKFTMPIDDFVPNEVSFMTSDSLEINRLNPIFMVAEPRLTLLEKVLYQYIERWKVGMRKYWHLSVCNIAEYYYNRIPNCVGTRHNKTCDNKVYMLAREVKRKYTNFSHVTIMKNHIRNPHPISSRRKNARPRMKTSESTGDIFEAIRRAGSLVSNDDAKMPFALAEIWRMAANATKKTIA